MTSPRLDRIAKGMMLGPFPLACYGRWHENNALVVLAVFVMLAGFGLYVGNGKEG